MRLLKKNLFLSLLVLFFSAGLVAQQVDIPLHNWTVPPFTRSSPAGITTMTDITGGNAFVGITPCRLLDTRPPVNNPLDGDGAYTANQVRSYTLPPHCGIPAFTQAVSLNITATNTQAHPFGFIKVWPQGGTEPNVSTLNWATGGVTVANAAIVPLSAGGGISVRSGNAGSDVILDINGYFPVVYNAGTSLDIEGSVAGGNMMFIGNFATSGAGTGIYAVSGSSDNNSAGLRGRDGGGEVAGSFTSAGVRGETAGAGYGVLGLSSGGGNGVAGFVVDPVTTNGLSGGYLGLSPTVGIFFFNGLAGTGTKSFVEPHPTDASKAIKFVSLEGNEAGTYFRGRGRFQNGIATVEVPEDFRMTTSPEGLSIQVTPIGQMATVAVQSIGLDRIVVRGSRNVEFFYMVNGVRRAYPHVETIVPNEKFFVPASAEARIPAYLSPDETQRLIDNGTYTPQGQVNTETARRLGWDRIWEQRSRPAPEPAP
jgi:hypothetical protein